MKKVLVLGLGISGKSVVQYLLQKKVTVIGVDKEEKNISDLGIAFFNENDKNIHHLLQEIDTLIKSPGIPWNHPLVEQAKEKNIEILSEMEIAFQALREKKSRVFGITGSNGKTTTTALTTHILNCAGKKAIACGNIGQPLLSQIDQNADIFVVELSSYQIETLKCPILDKALILNITPNHLERYSSFEAYAKAKLHIESLLKPNGQFFVQEKVYENFKKDISAPLFFPKLQIDETIAGIFPLRYRDGNFSHEYENFQAAFALCKEILTEKQFWEAATTFVKPPHRLEFVRKWKGVTFINDSKATSVDAVIKGINSIPGNLLLIAGGIDKGSSYKVWGDLFKDKVRKVLLIGRAQDKIYEELSSLLDVEKVGTLQDAVKRACVYAKEGETVLLSPGCSSYDQFQNFEQRGDFFKNLVIGL